MNYNELPKEDKDRIDGICMLASIGRNELKSMLDEGKITIEQHDDMFGKLHDKTKQRICEILLQ